MADTRFVILHHVLPSGEHWDFLLEKGEALAAWQLAANPLADPAAAIPARPLPDHRRLYLEYEGPISGDRGEVTRVADGRCKILSWSDDACMLELTTPPLSGRYELRASTAAAWKWRPARPTPVLPPGHTGP